MYLRPDQRAYLSLFTGPGGTEVGLAAGDNGWFASDAIEIDKHACATLRRNFPSMTVHDKDIRQVMAGSLSRRYYPLAVYTFPCDHYSEYSNVHDAQNGDDLYLHALRFQALLWPECILIENVLGLRKFPVVMELWRSLPQYYCTEFTVWGHDFTMMRKARVFLLLHRQPFQFQSLDFFTDTHQIPMNITLRRPGQTLQEYLENPAHMDALSLDDTTVIPSIGKRVNHEYGRDADLYQPDQTAIINLPTNYSRDRTVALVADHRSIYGYRPFSHRELARLHGFPDTHYFCGGKVARFTQVVDSVMPPVAYAFGLLLNQYFTAIDELMPQPQALGYRMISTNRSERLGTQHHRQPEEVTPVPFDLSQMVQTTLF